MTSSEPHPYLRYLAAWHRPEPEFHAVLDRFAGRPVRFAGVARPLDDVATCLAAFVADPMAALTEAPDGTLLLPGNPHRALHRLLELQLAPPYRTALQHLRWTLRGGRPPVDGVGRGAPFPPGDRGMGWPDEPRVDRYRRALFRGLLQERRMLGRRDGIPGDISGDLEGPPWPGGRRFAACVIHEVACAAGAAAMGNVAEQRAALGVPPVFFLAGHRPLWEDDGALEAVREGGGEIGLLGPDGRGAGLRSRAARVARTADAMAPALQRHDVRGFRDPTGRMAPDVLDALGSRFTYDCSLVDTGCPGRSGARSGCAVTVPVVLRGLVELPVTIPRDDHLGATGVSGLEWLELVLRKVDAVRARRGVISMVIRLDPRRGLGRVQRDLVAAALEEMADAGDVWWTTPGQLAGLWRRASDAPPPGGPLN